MPKDELVRGRRLLWVGIGSELERGGLQGGEERQGRRMVKSEEETSDSTRLHGRCCVVSPKRTREEGEERRGLTLMSGRLDSSPVMGSRTMGVA